MRSCESSIGKLGEVAALPPAMHVQCTSTRVHAFARDASVHARTNMHMHDGNEDDAVCILSAFHIPTFCTVSLYTDPDMKLQSDIDSCLLIAFVKFAF